MSEGKARVVVAMSGGVDSSVAAALLAEEGFEAAGVAMRLPSPDGEPAPDSPCCGVRGIEDARRVAAKIGIAFYALDFREEFRRAVIEDFVAAYAAGRTPNPCVRCNERLKFGRLLEKARAVGADHVATGHYARKDAADGRRLLRAGRGDDDQSYFLYALSQEQLGAAVFPVGDMTKDEVRRIARERALPVHDKPASQDLCFLPDGRYREFLRERCPQAFRPGPIMHVSGRVLGEHEGIAGFTVGQRRGLGVAHSEPLYVVEVRPEENAVVVGEREHVMREEILVGGVNWIAAPPEGALSALVRIRYNHPGGRAELTPAGDGRVRVRFAEPQQAPCPGQAAVFYDGDLVLGGGTIERESGTQR